MRFGREPFDAPEVQALVLAQQAEMCELYEGEGDIGPVREANMFEPPHGAFLVGRDDGKPIVCGGIVRFDDTRAELKRMYVVPAARGRGHGRGLLVALEDEARALGYTGIVLETATGRPRRSVCTSRPATGACRATSRTRRGRSASATRSSCKQPAFKLVAVVEPSERLQPG